MGHSGVEENKSAMFLALKTDVALLKEMDTRVKPATTPLFVTLLVADMPISLGVDLCFLPFAVTGELIHRNRPPQEVVEKRRSGRSHAYKRATESQESFSSVADNLPVDCPACP